MEPWVGRRFRGRSTLPPALCANTVPGGGVHGSLVIPQEDWGPCLCIWLLWGCTDVCHTMAWCSRAACALSDIVPLTGPQGPDTQQTGVPSSGCCPPASRRPGPWAVTGLPSSRLCALRNAQSTRGPVCLKRRRVPQGSPTDPSHMLSYPLPPLSDHKGLPQLLTCTQRCCNFQKNPGAQRTCP